MQVSSVALRKGDPDGLWPLPDWLAAVEGDETFAWAVKAWRDAARVDGAWFDYALADFIVADWPRWARLTSDRFAGVPFLLLKWQELIVRLLVGWQKPTQILDPLTHKEVTEHVRLFRQLRLWVPRKNGKTEFLAALGLLFFTMDELRGGQGHVFARNEDQARKPFDAMCAMARLSPDLQSDLIPMKRSIYSKSLAASIILRTGAEVGVHGAGPSVIVGDEMHEWKSRVIENTLRQGTGARLQPIELYASTTGRKTNLTGMELWNESLAILEGRVFAPRTLVVIYAAPPEADYRDESAWRKANPSLGLSVTLDFLRDEAAKCEGNPRAEMEFRCYHLDQWIDAEVRWIPVKKWDACSEDPKGLKKDWKAARKRLLGRQCLGAFDVSSTQDLTALAWLFPPIEGETKWQVLVEFWCPADNIEARSKNDKVDYRAYAEIGALTPTPGDMVDQDFVKDAVISGLSDFDVQMIGYDPWNATKLVTDLQKEGVPVEKLVKMRQGIQTLGEPSKHFERLAFAGLIEHFGHPVLRWMAGHVVVHMDRNLNYAPDKLKSGEKIDGIVTLVMAVGLAFAAEPDEEPEADIDI